jgi:hypothetical protein
LEDSRKNPDANEPADKTNVLDTNDQIIQVNQNQNRGHKNPAVESEQEALFDDECATHFDDNANDVCESNHCFNESGNEQRDGDESCVHRNFSGDGRNGDGKKIYVDGMEIQ